MFPKTPAAATCRGSRAERPALSGSSLAMNRLPAPYLDEHERALP